MAVSWTPFADGVDLLTLRNSFNTFNTAVKNNIDSIETSVTGLGTSKVSVSDTGLVFVVDGTMPSASLTTSYSKAGMVNTTSIDEANGHITVDNVLYTYTVATTGIYKLTFSGGMTADNGDLITFNYNVNGSSFITNPPQFVGQGANVVSINNNVVLSLTAGAVVYIEAKSDSTSTMTPINCGLMIEKTHY
jgi:hypothetical protein